MSELSKSNNPRVRRSYAHVMLGKLARAEVNVGAAQEAIRLADQTNKGRKSFFGRALLRAEEKGFQEQARQARERYMEAFHRRPTAEFETEIITAIPLPDGSLVPIVIGAGSHEDFDRAWEEGQELAQGFYGQQGATNHVLKSMAQAGGVMPEHAFWRGVMLGQIVEPNRLAEQTESPAEGQDRS